MLVQAELSRGSQVVIPSIPVLHALQTHLLPSSSPLHSCQDFQPRLTFQLCPAAKAKKFP